MPTRLRRDRLAADHIPRLRLVHVGITQFANVERLSPGNGESWAVRCEATSDASRATHQQVTRLRDMRLVRPIEGVAKSGIIRLAALMSVLAACTAGTSAPPVKTAAASAEPSRGPDVVLQYAPADFGCDSIGWPSEVPVFSTVRVAIDPAREPDVTAVSDTGRELTVQWVPGFFPGGGGQRIVLDPDGREVARDGQVIKLIEGINPELTVIQFA